jgi:hypothetical protein
MNLAAAVERNELVDRIAAHPNPRRNAVSRALQAIWRRLPVQRAFWVALDRAAALDSAKSVLAVIGAGAVLSYFASMHWWMMAPMAVFAFGVWYADYLRHF